MSPFVRTVKTASGATAVQIVHSSHRGSRDIEHMGSELVGRHPEAGGPLEITGSRMAHLWDALARGYDVLGFGEAIGGDEVFRQLVLAPDHKANQ